MSDVPNPTDRAAAGNNGPSPAANADTPHRPADDQEVVYFEGSPLVRGSLGQLFAYMGVALVLLVLPFLLYWLMASWPNGWVVAILWLAAVAAGDLAVHPGTNPALSHQQLPYRLRTRHP